MSSKRVVNIAAPSTGEEEWQALREPLFSGWLTQGPKVAAFEKAFAERHQVEHAIAVSNCTAALHVILSGMGIGPGDEVIVPAFTWVSTANAVCFCGATPVFADVNRDTYAIDPESVSLKVTERTKAIIAVHLFGLCADMDGTKKAAPDIPIVEDAACAAGAAYKNTCAGALGVAAAFSFHPRKSITTGEGGMITTGDDALATRMDSLRNHGASVSEEQRHHGPHPYLLPAFDLLGYNYRMTDMQGAVGIVQLTKLDQFIEERRRWAAFYERELRNVEWLRTPLTPQGYDHAWQSYVCNVDEEIAPMSRNEIMQALQDKGVSTRPGTHAVHMLGYYRDRFDIAVDEFPAARDADRYSMAIPLHNKMTTQDFEHVVSSIREIG